MKYFAKKNTGRKEGRFDQDSVGRNTGGLETMYAVSKGSKGRRTRVILSGVKGFGEELPPQATARKSGRGLRGRIFREKKNHNKEEGGRDIFPSLSHSLQATGIKKGIGG